MDWIYRFVDWVDTFLMNWDTSVPPSDRPMNTDATSTPITVPTPSGGPTGPATVVPDSIYLWDTPAASEHSVRLICDAEGLTPQQKDIIQACIHQESSFNNAAICRNKNAAGVVTSSDWGIVQCNDYWHIGPGKDFPSVEYVVNNPEVMVKWMIQCYKEGRLNQWVSYSSGAYKKYLKLA